VTGVAVEPRIRAAALMEHVHALSEQFPHRHTGEPDERGAAGYVAERLRALALEVRVHEYSVMGFEVVTPPRLELLAPEPLELECAPFIFSGSAPPGGLEGRLVHVGPTVVVGIAPPWEKYALVDGDGVARAFVVGRPAGPAIAQSGPPAGFAGTEDGPHYTWPSVVVGRDDLARLEAWRSAGEPIEARLALTTRYKPGCSSFVVEGELRGRAEPDRLVVVGAHHDCQGAIGFPDAIDSPGACDNASGVASVLELARFYREHGHPRTLRFCTYGGEEWNLTGSRHYVRELAERGDLARVFAKVNLDQTANGERLRIRASDATQPLSPGIVMEDLARANVAALGLERRFEVVWDVPPTPGSDHWPFYRAGVPIFYALWDPIPHYHRRGDTAAACDRDDKYEAALALAHAVIDDLGEVTG
jgi:hypothetical protein